MPSRLKDLRITSADLVAAGANPEARICLFKRGGAPGGGQGGGGPEPPMRQAAPPQQGAPGAEVGVAKQGQAHTFGEAVDYEAVFSQIWDVCAVFRDSLGSILRDGELDRAGKAAMMGRSLDEYAAFVRGALPGWAAGAPAARPGGAPVAKQAGSAGGEAAGRPPGEARPAGAGGSGRPTEVHGMAFDKGRMDPQDLAALAALEKKYGAPGPEGGPAGGGEAAEGAGQGAPAGAPQASPGAPEAPGIHPEVRKALADAEAARRKQEALIDGLRKSLELAALESEARKYEPLGKKPAELAQKLHGLKEAGGTAYADYVALLDEQAALVEKSGLFAEIGSSAGGAAGAGDELAIKAADIRKADPGLTAPASVARAFEENPGLAGRYEREYARRAF